MGPSLAEGNLSIHLSRLEEAGLIWMEKGFVGKRPKTRLGITPQGRRELASYIENLKEILDLS